VTLKCDALHSSLCLQTFLLTSLLQEDGNVIDWDSDSYVPTAATNMTANWTHCDEDGAMHDHELEVWDTAGQEALKSLRNMAYPDTHIFMIGYDMTRRNTLENIVTHDLNDLAAYVLPEYDDDDDDKASWMSELIQHCESEFQIILIGTKADYWDELKKSGTDVEKAELTTWQEGYDVAQAIGAKAYIQTSAKTYQGILEGGEGIIGGRADTQVNPDGVWLKSKICELRTKQLANKEIEVVKKVVKKVEVKQPEPAKPHVEAAKPTTPPVKQETAKPQGAAKPHVEAAKPQEDAKPHVQTPQPDAGPKKKDKGDKEKNCCTLL